MRSPHLHTAWGAYAWRGRQVAYRREAVETPDGDELILDHLDALEADPAAPRLLVIHGLEASSLAPASLGLVRAAREQGWNATALNFRSCAVDPANRRRILLNNRPRLYHSGETGDLDFVVALLRARHPDQPLLAAAYSLGANVLQKWLGEAPRAGVVVAAAAVSCPYDPERGEAHLGRTTLGRLYTQRFLFMLRRKARLFCARFPDAPADLAAALRARTFREFDDAVTAPLHGFRDALDYYRRASALGFVGRIDVPTLALVAEDDPFVAPGVIPDARAASSAAVSWVVTPGGGHCGFVQGPPWATTSWSDAAVARYLAAHL